MTDQLWRLPRVMEETGLSRSTVYELIAKDEFPRSIKIGRRAVAWRSSQVDAWKERQIAAAS